MQFVCLVQFVAALLFATSGTTAFAAAAPVPLDKVCKQPAAIKSWSKQEQFVWDNVCIGKSADFTNANEADYGGDNTLRSGFLETILLDPAYRKRLTRRGVKIIGARFDDLLDLKYASLDHQLTLNRSTLRGGIDFSGLSSTQGITLQRDAIGKDDDGQSIDLAGAHIAGSLDLGYNTKVYGTIEADTLVVGQAIYLNEGSIFLGKVNITYAKVGESLNFSSATIVRDVDLTGTQIEADFNLGPNTESGCGEDFNVRLDDDCEFRTIWNDASKLTLKDASAASIPNLSQSWAPRLNLDGFVYRSIEPAYVRNSSGDDDSTGDDNSIPLSLIQRWFHRQEYSAQPYEQLAKVFRDRGAIQTATSILYAGKDRERRKASHGFGYGWLTLLDALIGYGYYPQRAFVWSIGMVCLGSFVLATSGQGRANGLRYGFAYSFDMLLPIIKLREIHYKIDLKGWTRYYFYVHRISGWVLASFLVAGISGLTK